MRVDDFDFDLPEDLIALRPARPRRSSRLLVADGDTQRISVFERLADELREGDLLVFNDTKVIPARLVGLRRRETGGEGGEVKMEATLMKRLAPDTWRTLAKPGKRLKPGDQAVFGNLTGEIIAKGEAGQVDIRFDCSDANLDAAIAIAGVPPLPPYIAARRGADVEDEADYQTIFAENSGAVAAPTASLHFDDDVMTSLAIKGVNTTRLTLHVGAGTFLPVKTDDTDDHIMHSEWGEVREETCEAIAAARRAGGRVIAAGTTSLRLLETAATSREVLPWRGDTDIFITPGYQFQAVDGMITNFHLPRSTLMMLVSAFAGTDRIRALYACAIENQMRFYSYGDASLLWRAG
ncbi:MAG: tRNA preQ1(34) S-adenosylmethionine ribosyltransferase-isomerase QueA [Paracoccaceae bacterium]|jgi:S-adenosylmethionine:tRNA ribosyltransferase-isomerase|nr:tRNA preQ1(34) S-adenosylmethionine ribosyltransferase-isomerase QueA [Paracoccaceae bacterium]MDG1371391.1 tRNA preQ1(34) S-adenosylmethionine ribosyltransferase-isomerase QueA [Paracoccaceae bacterium]MDG1970726.1 tRNA preQ1(34) S-adenosylmethionine ribosyltransferase-isomerase QueA [Paracoccaceae bacterium]